MAEHLFDFHRPRIHSRSLQLDTDYREKAVRNQFLVDLQSAEFAQIETL